MYSKVAGEDKHEKGISLSNGTILLTLTQSAKPYLTCDLIDISWFDNLKSFWTGCFLKCISAPRQFKTPKRKLGGIFKVQCFPFHYAFIGLWSHGSPEAWYQHSKVFVLTAL